MQKAAASGVAPKAPPAGGGGAKAAPAAAAASSKAPAAGAPAKKSGGGKDGATGSLKPEPPESKKRSPFAGLAGQGTPLHKHLSGRFTGKKAPSKLLNALDSRRRNAAADKVEKAFFGATLFVFCLFQFQDKVFDLLVAQQLWAKSMEWALLVIVFSLLPGLLLCVSCMQRGRVSDGWMHLFLLGYYMDAWGCYKAGDYTSDFMRDSDVHVIFESLPQFMIQSQLVLMNHFSAHSCERSFDTACAAQCSSLPFTYGPDFSRFTCIQSGTEECWSLYKQCVTDCPAWEYLQAKQSADDLYNQALKSVDVFSYQTSSTRRLKSKKELQNVLDEDSPEWTNNLCDASAAEITVITDPFTGAPIQTLQMSVTLLWSQMISLISSAVSLAILRANRLMDERRQDVTNMRQWSVEAFCVACHFLLDMSAMCGAVSFFWASTHDQTAIRWCIMGAVVVLFQVVFKYGIPLHKNSHWFGRGVTAFMYIFNSPLSRLPSTKDMQAKDIRLLLLLRTSIQIAFTFCGFFRLARQNIDGLQSYQSELVLGCICVLGALAMTMMPGCSAIWDARWDEITANRLILVELKAFEKRKQGRLWMHWKVFVKCEALLKALEPPGEAAGPAAAAAGGAKKGGKDGAGPQRALSKGKALLEGHETKPAAAKAPHLPDPSEIRIDPATHAETTFRDLQARWGSDHTLGEIYIYWELECRPVHVATQGMDILSFISGAEADESYSYLHRPVEAAVVVQDVVEGKDLFDEEQEAFEGPAEEVGLQAFDDDRLTPTGGAASSSSGPAAMPANAEHAGQVAAPDAAAAPTQGTADHAEHSDAAAAPPPSPAGSGHGEEPQAPPASGLPPAPATAPPGDAGLAAAGGADSPPSPGHVENVVQHAPAG